MQKRHFNLDGVSKPLNLDAAQTIWLHRELEKVDETQYEEITAGQLASRYIPFVPDVNPAMRAYTYKMWGFKGSAEFAGPHNDDTRTVSLTAQEFTRTIKEIDVAYGWTVSEIRAAAQTRTPLDTMTIRAARRVAGQKRDRLLALGDTAHNIEGLLSLSTVDPALTTPTAKTSGTKWATAANNADQILADIIKVTSTLFTRLRQFEEAGFEKWTLLVPTDAYARIANTPRSTTSDTTILEYSMRTNPWIESIEPWYHCDTAGASGVGRLVAYPRDPDAGGGVVPEEFSPLDPQFRNKDIVVPVMSSCGGYVCRYPVAFAYMDGV